MVEDTEPPTSELVEVFAARNLIGIGMYALLMVSQPSRMLTPRIGYISRQERRSDPDLGNTQKLLTIVYVTYVL